MIFHLLKTDWQRLRWPIVGVWFLALLSALPWLFHTPESFTAPWMNQSGWDGMLPEAYTIELIRKWPITTGPVFLAALGLATAIGMIGTRWQGAMPLGKGTASTAKLLSLIAFIVLPHFLIGLVVMLILNIPIAVALSAGLSISLSLLIMLSVAATFGRLCGSGWAWLAGIVVYVGVVHLINELSFLTPLEIETRFFERGPRLWAMGLMALCGMLLLPKLLRTRSGQALSIAVGIISMVLAMFITRGLPATALLSSKSDVDAGSLVEGIGVTVRSTDISLRGYIYNRDSGIVSVSFSPTTTGKLPKHTSLIWTKSPSFSNSQNYESTLAPRYSQASLSSLEHLLPAPLATLQDNIRYSDPAIQFLVKKDEFSPDTELKASLKGYLFRYEEFADLPLSEETQTQSNGVFSLATRRIPDSERILIDVSTQGPAKGVARDAVELTAPEKGAEAFRVILYAPHSNACLELNQKLKYSSLSPGGARVLRRVMCLENWNALEHLNQNELRVLIYRPVTVAQIHRSVSFKPLEAQDRFAAADWEMSRNHRLEIPAYLETYRSNRPDPESVTEEEFARYLRVVSATLPEVMAPEDLAEFAPRFSELLALHSRRYPCANAIERGTPDDQSTQVINAIRGDLSNASMLASIAAKRGWLEEAKEPLLDNLRSITSSGSRSEQAQRTLVAALATLEDPETYPVLLKSLENTNSPTIYNTLRELPDISPALDETIGRISARLTPDQDFDSVISRRFYHFYDPYRVALAHGNPDALEKLLKRWKQLDKEGIEFNSLGRITGLLEPVPSIPRTAEAWDSFLAGKTAADFTHDPLTRKWRASSVSE
ncbi:hypothetical protein [Haloferula sp.]|uniref:hypothetical protein n=1 Tax=Haloferula sp. TaxID=2497595 RepID=UPI0032A0D1E0